MAKKQKRSNIYCDGGFYKQTGLVKWAYCLMDSDNEVERYDVGRIPAGSGFEVEEAESEAILQALSYCNIFIDNYTIHTDSRSVLDKIENKVPNATANPRIKAIQNLIKLINESPHPQSVTIKYCKRRSNRGMQFVDDLVEK